MHPIQIKAEVFLLPFGCHFTRLDRTCFPSRIVCIRRLFGRLSRRSGMRGRHPSSLSSRVSMTPSHDFHRRPPTTATSAAAIEPMCHRWKRSSSCGVHQQHSDREAAGVQARRRSYDMTCCCSEDEIDRRANSL